MKKVNWFFPLSVVLILFCSGCSGPGTSVPAGSESKSQSLSVAPPPGSSLEATGVHEISYNVLKMLANDYNSCNCQPNMDSLFFGAFMDTTSIRSELSQGGIEGVYIHLCLSAQNEFYLALSGASGIPDSTLKAETMYPTGTNAFTFKSNSFDDFMNNEIFSLPTSKNVKGSVITADRERFAATLTCDLNGDNNQDALSTVPYGFVNVGEFDELLDQSTAPYISLMMGYDPTMFPNVMRVLLVSTKMQGTNQIKMIKMSPSAPTHYALFLERARP